MRSLFIVPLKPNTVPSLKRLVCEKMEEVKRSYGDSIQVVIDERGSGDRSVVTLDDRQCHLSSIRQSILNDVLRSSHRDVFWMDADVLDFDVGVIGRMREFGGICAPLVLFEGSDAFYDLAGFVEDGVWIRQSVPYFNQTGNVVKLDCVGAFYRVPASVFFAGGYYYPVSGFTEHYSVCEFARLRMGMDVVCDTGMSVMHIDPRKYGQDHHRNR